MTNDSIRIQNAFIAGKTAAESLKIGDIFLGAWPAADSLGFSADTLERSVFTTAYLASLPGTIVSTRNNVIIAIEAR